LAQRRAHLCTSCFVGDLKKIGQGRLVAQQEAELEERGVAAADLGEADELGGTYGDFVRRQGAVARGQEDSSDGIIAGFELGDISTGFVYGHSAGVRDAKRPQAGREEVAQPAVGFGHVFRDAGAGQADGAAQHKSVQEEGATAGAARQHCDTSGMAAVCVDD